MVLDVGGKMYVDDFCDVIRFVDGFFFCLVFVDFNNIYVINDMWYFVIDDEFVVCFYCVYCKCVFFWLVVGLEVVFVVVESFFWES